MCNGTTTAHLKEVTISGCNADIIPYVKFNVIGKTVEDLT